MSLAPQLKDLLVCPLGKGKVEIREDDQEIWCRADGLALFEAIFQSCSLTRPGP